MVQSHQNAEYQENVSGVDVMADGEQIIPENPTPVPDALPVGSIKELFTDNLFKDVKNSILTLVFGAITLWILYKAFGFVFLNEKIQTNAEGETVIRSGWEVIRDGPFIVYMVGNRFAESGVELYELWIAIYLVAASLGLGIGRPKDPEAPKVATRTTVGILAPASLGLLVVLSFASTATPWLLSAGMIATILAVRAIGPILWTRFARVVPWAIVALLAAAFYYMTSGGNFSAINSFGGLLLTITVAAAAITLSFPFGVVAALARRSSFPLIRPVAVAYIELIRGVPLITLLFMGQFAVGFFFPPGAGIPGPVGRAIIMFTLFTGAYVAEIVRGGLQSVPNGQIEAGQAVGLSPLTITRRIVLPQALRNSIPALVGQFISVLKDTSLLVIIGLLDLLGVTDPVLANLRFTNQGFSSETYAFVAFLFWIMCFSMSRASQRLETKLGVGQR